MDGCPRQNSKTALRAVARIGGLVFKIPPRSPDLNPIENFFNLVVQKLNNEAIEKDITDKTFQSFSERVKSCMLSFPVKIIDKIISPMDKRINMVLKVKGKRLNINIIYLYVNHLCVLFCLTEKKNSLQGLL